MEKCNVPVEDRKVSNEEISVSGAELHLLIEFFQRLDRWDRELRQNGSHRSEVIVCSVQ
jgi:phage anti-repressor protein